MTGILFDLLLYGCTSIVVLNDACLWISHFFKNPSFVSGDEVFKRDVLYALRKGDNPRETTATDPADWHDYGLADLVKSGVWLSGSQHVFIITPRPRTYPPEAAPAGTLMYANRVAQIKGVLEEMMPDAVIQISDYTPRGLDQIYHLS